MKLSILSKPNSILSKSSLKRFLRIFLGKMGGPSAVEESLKRGLSKIKNIEYNFNPKTKNLYETAVVIQGVDTLEYALELKNKSKIKNLFAGPNIILSPKDNEGVLQNENVKKILVPSNWVKDFYISETPSIKDKIEIWPAGVEDTNEISDKSAGLIIYYKNAPLELLENIKEILNKKNIKWNLLKYGKYNRSDYFNLLKTTKGIVFLSSSESQGIALQEAWIRNVPTLVWRNDCMKNGQKTWYDEKISAPYLTDESGLFFDNEKDILEKIDLFLSKNFEPRKYCLENLTDEISVRKLLEIIENNLSR